MFFGTQTQNLCTNLYQRLKLLPTKLPERNNVRDGPSTDFELAREKLHVGAIPESLPCREMEFAELYGYLEASVIDGGGACIYVSGVPGTGKTATFHSVLRMLQAQVEEEVSF